MFTSSTDMAPRGKFLFLGPAGVGKTMPSLMFPGPLAVFDGEDGVRAYRKKFTFDATPFDGVDDLNAKLEQFRNTPEYMAKYTSVAIDGATQAWHHALNEVTDDKGNISIEKQRELKSGFKLVNDHIFALGKASKNVVVTAQSKNDWDIQKGKAPRLRGTKADIDPRIWFAFDAVISFTLEEDGSRTATWLKSRWDDEFPVGTITRNFDFARHILPLISEAPLAASAPRSVTAEVRSRLMARARQLGSVQKGGVIPNELGAEIAAALQDEATPSKRLLDLYEQLDALVREEPVAV